MPPTPLILGLDGGGTKTVAWLAPLDDPTSAVVLGRGQAGPGNPRAAGFETAQANIAAAIAAAFDAAGLPPAPVAAACFGLAGAGREAEQRRIAEWATKEQIAAVVRVTGDAEPILAAAAPENCGIALICGTGSFAWGRSSSGEVARCGGWGYLVGDEGSGYAMARAGLIAALRFADGRSPHTTLLERFLQHWKLTTPDALVQHIYAPEMTRQRMASLARIVFDAALDDPIAQSIIASATADLAELVTTLARRLGFAGADYVAACTGGVLVNQPSFREQLRVRLDNDELRPQAVTLVEFPVAGALALARASLRV